MKHWLLLIAFCGVVVGQPNFEDVPKAHKTLAQLLKLPGPYPYPTETPIALSPLGNGYVNPGFGGIDATGMLTLVTSINLQLWTIPELNNVPTVEVYLFMRNYEDTNYKTTVPPFQALDGMTKEMTPNGYLYDDFFCTTDITCVKLTLSPSDWTPDPNNPVFKIFQIQFDYENTVVMPFVVITQGSMNFQRGFIGFPMTWILP